MVTTSVENRRSSESIKQQMIISGVAEAETIGGTTKGEEPGSMVGMRRSRSLRTLYLAASWVLYDDIEETD